MYEEHLFFREVELHAKVVHPCVLPFNGYSLPSETTPAVIYTQLIDGTTLQAVMKRVREGHPPSYWNPTGIAIIVAGIVMGMKCIHETGILHRDLKPGNIMITCQGKTLIGDFGSACSEADKATRTPEPGTIHYSAPELFTGDQYDSKVDVFSFGSILYEILTEQNVFPDNPPPVQIMNRLLNNNFPEIPDAIGDAMKSLITNCWRRNPSERPKFSEIFGQLEQLNFMISPGVDVDLVRKSVQEVIDWETMKAEYEAKKTLGSSRSPEGG
jgi:serine/threonine protein kinase